ncbi:MAG TPA: hypothetical protein VK187_13560, partial [Geobacteraceae bacterium]|nr:hypothetical protein [Geobacteraceae bacterium]
MRLGKALILSGCLFLAACAGQKPAATPSPAGEEYVEVPNPALTMTADQPATIWVPRSYVESGVPRGSEVIKRGVEKAFPSKSDQQPAPPAPAIPQPPATSPQKSAILPAYQKAPTDSFAPAPVPATPALVKHRMVAIETGQNGLSQTLQEQLRQGGGVLIADSSQAAFLAQS